MTVSVRHAPRSPYLPEWPLRSPYGEGGQSSLDSVLYDHFRLSVHRQHFRCLRLFQSRDVGLLIAQEVGKGVYLAGVEHKPLSMNI